MRRTILLAVLALALISLQVLMNCSQQLEGIDGPVTNPPVTIVKTDTVIIFLPHDDHHGDCDEDDEKIVVCSRLTSNINEIVWWFENEAESFSFHFEATTERDHPSKTLLIEIDDLQFFWDLSESKELLVEAPLKENGKVRITASKPPSLGHPVDICMSMCEE